MLSTVNNHSCKITTIGLYILFCATTSLWGMREESLAKRQRLSSDKTEYYQEINQTIIDALEQNDFEMVKRFFILSPAQQIIEEEFSTSPVELCTIIREFIPSELNFDIQTKTGGLVLHAAVERENINLVQMILATKTNPDIYDKLHKQTALHIAARKGNIQLIKILIDKDADIDACDGKGETPLHKAVRHAHEDIVELLITEDADLFIKNKPTITYPTAKTPRELAIQQIRRVESRQAKSSRQEEGISLNMLHEKYEHIIDLLTKAEDYEIGDESDDLANLVLDS